MRRFEYFAPSTVEEACLLLNRYGTEAKIIAGGTDILVNIKNRTVITAVSSARQKEKIFTNIDSTVIL